jgi:hypothetical protein
VNLLLMARVFHYHSHLVTLPACLLLLNPVTPNLLVLVIFGLPAVGVLVLVAEELKLVKFSVLPLVIIHKS